MKLNNQNDLKAKGFSEITLAILCGLLIGVNIILPVYGKAEVLSDENFDVHHNASKKQLANEVLIYATMAKAMIEDRLGYSLKKTTILLERPPVDRYSRDFKAFIDKAYFDPIPLKRYMYPERIIAHELVHVAVHQMLGEKKVYRIPTWFYEGLSVHLCGYPKGASLQDLCKEGKLIPLSNLRKNWGNPLGKLAQVGYAESGKTVDYLVEKMGRDALPQILQMANNKNNFDEAIFATCKFSLDDFEKQSIDYIKEHCNHKDGDQ